MFVRDIMTTNVVTIASNTSIIKAKRIMDSKKLKRLPVVSEGKLVGVVTAQRLERVVPPETGRSMWELTYSFGSLYRTRVKEIMQKDVVTAAPDMTVEEAVALAQSKKVGALIVVEDSKVIGIVTTNDFFYRIVNKVLGVGEPGTRIEIAGGGEGEAIEEIVSIINKRRLKIITLHIIAPPNKAEKDIIVHVDCKNTDELVAELMAKGYKVDQRKR